MKHKIKLGIILGVEFVAIIVILALIFFAGKKTYTVTFDLNGGVLISGDLEQTVAQGKSATAPTVAKDGCYLRSWSTSFKSVTKDIVVKAVWEWETSTGFNYTSTENSDYCEIVSSYEHLYGDVYVGAYHDEKLILGMQSNAFYNRDGITNVHMLDGILYIGDQAFADCDNLESVELPGTLKALGTGVFYNCVSLESIVLPDGLEAIPADAFKGCTSLKEIVIPASVKTIAEGAFAGCTSLEKITFETEDVVEVDEETGEEKVVGKKGLEELGNNVFYGCTALTEIQLPETIKVIAELTFDATFADVEFTVYLPMSEEEAPEGFAENWSQHVTVVWNHKAPEREPVEDDKNEDDKE